MNEIKAKIKFAKAGIKVKAEDEKRFEDSLELLLFVCFDTSNRGKHGEKAYYQHIFSWTIC